MISSTVHVSPPSVVASPEYVAPRYVSTVAPKVGAAVASTTVVLRYVCAAVVAAQPDWQRFASPKADARPVAIEIYDARTTVENML
jgi:hypothetical protein